MIEVENLSKFFGPYPALKNISFRVKKGEILGFLGPNGAGKSTAMRILTCFFPASSGTAKVAGFDVFTQSLEVRKRIGYLPENVPLYGDMTPRSYLHFAAELKGVTRGDRKNHVGEIIETCGVKEMADKLIKNLSKGYKQRVGIAQALIGNPELLILDEPTSGLDPKQIIEIRKLIKSLAGEKTIILSTHILPEVSQVCERIIIINEGRIVAVDTPDNLMNQLEKTTRLFIKVEGEADAVLGEIGALHGIKTIHREGEFSGHGIHTLIVETEKGHDARKEISRTIVEKNLGLLELRPLEMSLEDIFIKLVTKEEGGHV
jgi:ABC-2 type transport system ATP-binding protein